MDDRSKITPITGAIVIILILSLILIYSRVPANSTNIKIDNNVSPGITTLPADQISANSVTLSSTNSSNYNQLSKEFIYGADRDGCSNILNPENTQNLGHKTLSNDYVTTRSVNITGLKPDTYYCAVYVVISDSTPIYGNWVSFRTFKK